MVIDKNKILIVILEGKEKGKFFLVASYPAKIIWKEGEQEITISLHQEVELPQDTIWEYLKDNAGTIYQVDAGQTNIDRVCEKLDNAIKEILEKKVLMAQPFYKLEI